MSVYETKSNRSCGRGFQKLLHFRIGEIERYGQKLKVRLRPVFPQVDERMVE